MGTHSVRAQLCTEVLGHTYSHLNRYILFCKCFIPHVFPGEDITVVITDNSLKHSFPSVE